MDTVTYDHNHFVGGARSGPQPGDESLLVRFVMKTVEDRAASEKEGRPIFKDTPYVEISIPGERNVKRYPASLHYQQRFPRHWEAFSKRNEEIEHEGTPLTEWPIIKRAQAEELKFFNIYTVEQLATMSDGNAQNMRGLQTLKEKAKAYLAASGDTAILNEVDNLKTELEEQKRQNAEMLAAMNDLKDQVVASKVSKKED